MKQRGWWLIRWGRRGYTEIYMGLGRPTLPAVELYPHTNDTIYWEGGETNMELNKDGGVTIANVTLTKEQVAQIKTAKPAKPAATKFGWHVWQSSRGTLAEVIARGEHTEYHGEDAFTVTFSQHHMEIQSSWRNSGLGTWTPDYALGWYNG